MANENQNHLVTIQHIRQLAQRIVDELDSLEQIDSRLQAIEKTTGIDCGEIISVNN